MPITKQEARQWAKNNSSYFLGIDDLASAYMAGVERGEFIANHAALQKEFPTPSQLDEIKDMYVNQRKTVKYIAFHYGKKPRHIGYILRKNNIVKTVKWDDKKRRFIKKHLYKDRTVRELARKYKTTEASIRSIYYSK